MRIQRSPTFTFSIFDVDQQLHKIFSRNIIGFSIFHCFRDEIQEKLCHIRRKIGSTKGPGKRGKSVGKSVVKRSFLVVMENPRTVIRKQTSGFLKSVAVDTKGTGTNDIDSETI